MLLRICLLMSISAAMYGQSGGNVSIRGLDQNGLILVPFDSALFKDLASRDIGAQLPVELAPALPYSVVLRNHTDKRIIAYTVRWTRVDQSGQAFSDDRTAWSMIAPRGADVVEPHTDRFVSLLHNSQLRWLSRDPEAQQSLARDVENLSGAKGVEISLDAVVFADGQVVGPDFSDTAKRVQARLSAEKELYLDVLAQLHSGTAPEEIFAPLEELSAHERDNRDFGPDLYTGYYRLYRMRTAVELVRARNAKGDDAVFDFIRGRLESKAYPIVHR